MPRQRTDGRRLELGERLIEEAMLGNLDGVRELISYGADANFANTKGVTPLMVAAHWDRLEVVRFLLERGVDVEAREKSVGRNALMYSCLSGSPQCVELILEAGAAVNSSDSSGRTALMMAAMNGVVGVVEPLVRAGADMSFRDEFGLTALDLATRRRRKDVVAFLSARGAGEEDGRSR